MHIGLVIPSDLGYSEIFFSSKIKGLQSSGFKVTLFVNQRSKSTENSIGMKVAPKLSGNRFKVFFVSVFCLFHTLLFRFKVSMNLYHLDKKDGLGFKQRIKNLISNSHILSESVDWLHFGFGTMVFQRENVAAAIGAKMGVSFRGFDIGVYPIKHPYCYDTLWKKVDKIHVISEDIKDLLYVHNFKDQASILKITPAISVDYFTMDTKQKDNEIFQFMTVARLHWKKGLDYTLEALALLMKEGVNFHYTIIGSGSKEEHLKFLAHQLGLTNQVTFAGKLPQDKVKDQLAKSDVYIQYSVQEGFCNAVLEAQAMGLLCVVSDAEGLSENVLDNQTGWVVPLRQPKELSDKIMGILKLPEAYKIKIRKQAQERVRNEYNIKIQQEAFVKFYIE